MRYTIRKLFFCMLMFNDYKAYFRTGGHPFRPAQQNLPEQR